LAATATQTKHQYTEADFNDFEHVGPDTLMGRYLRTFWHPVYISEQLKPGWAVPVKLMNEPFTLYRGESGTVHAVEFRCPHRGTQLSTGFIEDDNLRCRYHGWVFDGEGRCVEQPLEKPPFMDRIRMRSYPVQEYLGLIFAYLGEGEPPPLPRYPRMEREGLLEWAFAPRACNYFNELENDPEHVPFTHRDPRLPRGEYPLADSVRVEESNWGIAQHRSYGDAVLIVQHGMPNIRSTAHGKGAEVFRFKVPVDDENLVSFEVEYYPMSAEEAAKRREAGTHKIGGDNEARAVLTQEILAGKHRLYDFDVDPPPGISMFNLQDDVTQVGQGVFRDREREHLGSSDAYVVLLRNLFRRELRAFAEGRPLKHWELTDDLVNTSRPWTEGKA
jgi:5,5'-dehydrodivanillate O-demethylase oxygenase subunit